MRIAFALIAGALFGAGLYLSGMTDTDKVQGFLDIFGAWDPTLAFVMGGAIVPMALAWQRARGGAPLAGGRFPQPASRQLDKSLFVGSAIFGVGWGLAGLCPGPAIASVTYGGLNGLWFLLAIGAGFVCAPAARRRLDSAATVT